MAYRAFATNKVRCETFLIRHAIRKKKQPRGLLGSLPRFRLQGALKYLAPRGFF